MIEATSPEKTMEHDWKLMTMADVIVIGIDPHTDEPTGIVTSEIREGVNCGVCGVPWFPETSETACVGH